jgi:N-acetyl-anhydromuramyl-L-alanine amidase AmpD
MIQYKTNNTSGQTNTMQYIVLHHTGTLAGTAQGNINTCVNGKVSFHYLIDEK